MKVVNTFEQMLPFGCLSLSLGLELKSTKYIAGIKSTRSLPVNTTWVLGCGGWHRLKESQYRRLMDRLLFFFFFGHSDFCSHTNCCKIHMKVMHLKHRTSVQNTRKKTMKSINKKNQKKTNRESEVHTSCFGVRSWLMIKIRPQGAHDPPTCCI